MEYKISLTSKTHPEVEIKRIDFEKDLVIFKNRDGWNMAPLKLGKNKIGKILTEDELKASVEAVLGELKEDTKDE